MLTHDYTYTNILDRSVNNPWTVDDCYQGRDFDFTKSFLPERIAGVRNIACLNDDERRKLNQIRGNSYCHIFGFVEEYIVPMVMTNARPRHLRRRNPPVVAAALRRRRAQTPGADAPRL